MGVYGSSLTSVWAFRRLALLVVSCALLVFAHADGSAECKNVAVAADIQAAIAKHSNQLTVCVDVSRYAPECLRVRERECENVLVLTPVPDNPSGLTLARFDSATPNMCFRLI